METEMKGKRKQYSPEFKAKVAVAAIQGSRTLPEIAARFEVHPTMVAKWKREAMEALPGVFADGRRKRGPDEERVLEQLYGQIGRLKVENDWLKKKSALVD